MGILKIKRYGLEYPHLISERIFSRSFGSFWRMVTPTCDLFVRRLNLDLYEIFDDPIVSQTTPERRGLINEIAFEFFRLKVLELNGEPDSSPEVPTIRARVFSECREKLARLERAPKHTVENPNIEELQDIKDQSLMLLRFFGSQVDISRLRIYPKFSGCGIINSCAGDVLFENALYEVKAGDRRFRSNDIRQLITYAALNAASREHEINSVGLFNPRQGTSFELGLEELCYEIAGKGKTEILSEIVYAISSGDISH